MRGRKHKLTASALRRAITAKGSQQALADALDVRQSAISKWLHGHIDLTAERAVQIEQVTGGAVKRHELRPDLWSAA